MNRHQVLTGAANNNETSVSIGSVENQYFIAYASGCNIVILSSKFERVQVTSDLRFANRLVKCVDCTLDSGKIAASYGNIVKIFEPTPSAKKDKNSLHYKWIEIDSIEVDSNILALSWNNEGNQLLIGCDTIQIWSHTFKCVSKKDTGKKVEFSINSDSNANLTNKNENIVFKWKKIWQTKIANPLKFLQYSPDGSMFASYGENDRLVKIWYEVRSASSIVSNEDTHHANIQYNFIYLAHPRAVTHVSWRRISKFMPRGMIANSLITCCKDNICRIWSETILPDDGLIHTNQDENSSVTASTKTSRHKRTLLHKLHKMRLNSNFAHFPSLSHFKNHHHHHHHHNHHNHHHHNHTNHHSSSHSSFSQENNHLQVSSGHSSSSSTTLNGHNNHHHHHRNSIDVTNNGNNSNKIQYSQSCQDFHFKHVPHSNINSIMNLGFHFHLAGFINAENGIPLHPNIGHLKGINFIVHWMNNKEFTFTLAAEMLSKEILDKLRKIQMENELKETKSSDDDNEDDSRTQKLKENLSDSHLTKMHSNNPKIVLSDECLMNIDEETKGLLLSNAMDQRLDKMMKDWYSSHDMLFSVHPVDGSILIWIVDWLDEYMPGGFRQAQISFHAKLPNAVPVGDAVSMSSQIIMFSSTFQSLINNKSDDDKMEDCNDTFTSATDTTSDNNEPQHDLIYDHKPYKPQSDLNLKVNLNFLNTQSIINMVSKHNNGTLNLWQLTFQESTKYQLLINVLHLSRICGHRFHVSDITCHPTLPLLLSNSQNTRLTSIRDESVKDEVIYNPPTTVDRQHTDNQNETLTNDKFQTGLIIWRVEPVGPLSKSGGIFELARIDSSSTNSFENIAWFPCFLPSSTLGTVSSSPSTLFATTDSECITIYQAVLDARTLLHEMQFSSNTSTKSKLSSKSSFSVNEKTQLLSTTTDIPYNSFDVVSIQSTARPGCIIKLEQIVESKGNWKKSHLFHVFPENLILSSCNSNLNNMHMHTDLRQNGGTSTTPSTPTTPSAIIKNLFSEKFFLILLEKTQFPKRPVIHMWKISISSANLNFDEKSHAKSMEFIFHQAATSTDAKRQTVFDDKNRITITSSKVCKQELNLPPNVQIICAEPAAANLSCMFTLSKVPYLFATACSDGVVRFWSCDKVETNGNTVESVKIDTDNDEYIFYEWFCNSSSSSGPRQSPAASDQNEKKPDTTTGRHHNEIKINGYPIAASCAYNGRFAIAYRMANSKTTATNNCHNDRDNSVGDPSHDDLFMNLCVRIYECESSGGSDWKLEDSIELQNIKLPELDSGIDFDYIYGNEKPIHPSRSSHSFKHILFNSHESSQRSVEIPSQATRMSIMSNQIMNKRQFSINSSMAYLTRLVQLDWASMENGSHILTVGLGNKIFIYSCVARNFVNDIDPTFEQRRQRRSNSFLAPASSNNSSIGVDDADVDDLNSSLFKWVKFRSFELDSADGMQALPVQMKWARDGLLVIGLDTEMQVYSQWSSRIQLETMQHKQKQMHNELTKIHKPCVHDLNRYAKANLSGGMPVSTSIADKQHHQPHNENMLERPATLIDNKSDALEFIQDNGLFVHAKREWPVLPQYHPKQLIELMNSGKINRVKIILMHLTRCIIDCDLATNKTEANNNSYKFQPSDMRPDEHGGTHLEIDVIPALPMFALNSTDHDECAHTTANTSAKTNGILSNGEDDTAGVLGKMTEYDELFGSTKVDNRTRELGDTELDDIDMDDLDTDPEKIDERERKEDLKFKQTLLLGTDTINPNSFTPHVCKILNEYLTRVHLKGLDSIDQMYLVALADTVANVKCDVTFSVDEDMFAKREYSQVVAAATQQQPQRRSSIIVSDHSTNDTASQILDNCGLKFLLALRHYNYLLRTLPVVNRSKLVSIGTSNFAWAFHSECENELLNSLPHVNTAVDLKWHELKQYGVGWWIKSPLVLRQLMEKVAKCAFQAKNDPLDAAIYYLAMKKKGVLLGLFKLTKDLKMTDFFKNDFSEHRWHTAALKNAYSLLGKQRFEHAAAFFLLAGKLKDAVDICLRHMHDIQLAFVIIRLFEADTDQALTLIKDILCREVLGYDSNRAIYDQKKALNDPFLRSIAYWFIKEYDKALVTLYDVDIGSSDDSNVHYHQPSHHVHDTLSISNVFNFYVFLKNHPLLIRKKSLQNDTTSALHGTTLSSIERRLHFRTAYYHVINGCPLLALDVLSQLPKYIDLSSEANSFDSESTNDDASEQRPSEQVDQKTNTEKADQFDWSATVTKPKIADDFEIKFSDDDSDDDDLDVNQTVDQPTVIIPSQPSTADAVQLQVSTRKPVVDLFAQQLKLIACLKILIEEMSTLATGFEVTGGQLRFYMYYWLERETNILKDLSDYRCEVCENCLNDESIDDDENFLLQQQQLDDGLPNGADQLHEQVIKDQKKFQAKVHRLNRRKLWLRSNELILRTLLSYCSLHSAHGGGLASVRMELILLMQELCEDRGIKQLLSPLPPPTTIPLLTAIIASSKTVVAGPIRMIQSLISDILSSISTFVDIPTVYDSSIILATIRELSVSLSACVYQCLCDSDAFTVPSNAVVTGMQGFCRNIRFKSTYLMSGLRQSIASAIDMPMVDTLPKDWPGVSALNKLLEREQDTDAPKLKILLLESLIAVFSALFLNSFVSYDCSSLWRLLAQQWDGDMWAKFFGGGCKTEYKYRTSNAGIKSSNNEMKHRMKMNARLGQVMNTNLEDKVFLKEHFIPPQISMINFFMSKPEHVESMNNEVNYDTDDDDDETFCADKDDGDLHDHTSEHMDPNSYSWCIMRFAIVKYLLNNITKFLNLIGLEPQETAASSPLIHMTLKTLENWQTILEDTLNRFNCVPDNYIPACNLNANFTGPKLLKYQSMLDPLNTPFTNEKSAKAAKRLWHFLVTRKCLHDTFIRYIFKKKKKIAQAGLNQLDFDATKKPDLTTHAAETQTFKIIHKDQEAIYSFCLNEREKSMLALATSKEIIEMDINSLLAKNVAIEDECEMDILAINSSRTNLETQDMLLIGNTNDPYTHLAPSITGNYASNEHRNSVQMTLKRNFKEVRRLASHPMLPYYLCGTTDGVVKLWHWGSTDALSSYKQGEKASSAKITKLAFNIHGNKFGVSDIEGNLNLYQLLGCSFKSYMNLKCHKSVNDFLFVDSSSLLLTAGIYNDSYEVSMWDTLMPTSKSLVMNFREQDIPSATCVAYSSLNHLAYVGNRKGELTIYDIRMLKILKKIDAHESSVKAITIDPEEYYFSTGSSEGNIKIWNLKTLSIVHTFHGDHSKSSLIRNFNSGVNQLMFTSRNQILSCGMDGAILIRNLTSSIDP